MNTPEAESIPSVPFREALSLWARIGLLSFGGPAGQIALMHRMVVDEKKWVDEKQFLHALNYCMLLPGPEAQQLATYLGWLLHGVRGGLVAGILFILPGALAILALSFLYVLTGGAGVVEGIFLGLKAAVLAIVLQAMIRLARKALKGALAIGLAIGGFLALFAFNVPFPFVVLSAGLIGYLVARWATSGGGAESGEVYRTTVRPGTRRAAAICLGLWLVTVAGVVVLFGGEHVLAQVAVFFSQMAVVTFGGAYAVLAYVAQQGVEVYGWLQPGQMLDGLGLAETTPGPLILVTQFVGFLGGYQAGGLWMATVAALLTTWVTFLPCFLWIFAGAPYVEKLRGNKNLSAAMAGITAAVVGVIANLALWFGLNSLFREREEVVGYGLEMELPVLSSVDPVMLGLTALSLTLAFVFKRGVFTLIGICAGAGLVVGLVG